ncbi:hypothetical protein OAI40_07395 [Candidatus Pseudothioglobus singularis]|nr:hypothetical protein [Candidatus Pseudothioglobus singularis]MDB4599022.1 hypothetical protein [Candidatus Pseudothioglobus singularis]
MNYNPSIKKLFLPLILSFFSAQSFASSCPYGTELVKSVSEDGTYFLFHCNIVINPPPEEMPLPPEEMPLPPEETTPNPDGYKPGWKIQEGSNFWSVDLDSPYWKTEEGSKEFQASKKRGSWIEKAASDYAKENPGVDAPTSSYYATDGCGEGKQPANSSC